MNNNKQRLFEVMEKLNPSFNTQNSEQSIIDDILSVDEGVGDMLAKLIDYGRKGLLTAAIVIAVALSAQAQQQNKSTEVIKAGTEVLKNDQQKVIYAFMVGIAQESVSLSMKKRDVEAASAFKEIARYYEAKRDGFTPQELTPAASTYLKVLFNSYSDLSTNQFNHFVQLGMNLHMTD